MILGFTGASFGMTQRQRATVRHLFAELPLTELHHGDCIGADEQADVDAYMRTAATVIVHPPIDTKKRAFCRGDRTTVLGMLPYLKRNWAIVYAATDGVIAAPKDSVEPVSKRGQGTWTTIGYARKLGRRVWLVLPDGTFTVERP